MRTITGQAVWGEHESTVIQAHGWEITKLVTVLCVEHDEDPLRVSRIRAVFSGDFAIDAAALPDGGRIHVSARQGWLPWGRWEVEWLCLISRAPQRLALTWLPHAPDPR